MPAYTERKKKYIDKLKLQGKFDEYKQKRAKLEKERRNRLKDALAKLSVAKRNQIIEENRIKIRKGVQKFRTLKKQQKLTENCSSDSNKTSQHRVQLASSNDTNQQQLLSLNCNDQVAITTSTEIQQKGPLASTCEHFDHSNIEANGTDNNTKPKNITLLSTNTRTTSEPPSSSIQHVESQVLSSSPLKNISNQPDPASPTENCDSQPKVEASSTDKKRYGQVVSKSIGFPHSYKTQSALSKAATKTARTLPSSPSKRKAVMARLFRSFSDEDQRDIIGSAKLKGIKTNKGLSSTLLKEIRLFYERDDISRISPNVKDMRKFANPDTGEKEDKQIRYLNYKLSEVYQKFLDENEGDRTPVKLSKFSALRPEHVFLMAETPRNVCFCLYHTNFILCSQSLHKNVPDISGYGPKLTELLVCDTPTKDCYFKSCKNCDKSKIDSKIKIIANQSPNKDKTVKWMLWKKDESANRVQMISETGSQSKLVDYFLSIYPQFLKHSYVKRQQEKAFTADRKRVISKLHCCEAVLQVDFAENFKCENQDEVQQAHYNQKQVSLFTSALHHAGSMDPKVITSDNTHHSKETLVAYLYAILKELPSTIKTLKVWSDGPSNQFKNKYIAAIIPLFEKMFDIKIIWNFFATGHGKSCIDGIGAAVKGKVKGLVLTRAAIVNNTKDFVEAFRSKQSKITLVEMTDADIERINNLLKLNEVFANAPTVREISKFHQMIFLNGKIKGFATSADGQQE